MRGPFFLRFGVLSCGDLVKVIGVGRGPDIAHKVAHGIGEIADKVLVGGRLPEYLGFEESIRSLGPNEKIVTANLVMDKEDITINSIERFEGEIEMAKTIVVAGPMGKYEDEGHRQGTQRVFAKVAAAEAYKVTGGGDSHVVVSLYKLEDKFDWISVGGGAMLEFLAKKTLPGIEALLE